MIVRVHRLCGGPILVNTRYVVHVQEHRDIAGEINGCALMMDRAAVGSWNEIAITETRDQFYELLMEGECAILI